MDTDKEVQWAIDLLAPNPNYEENFVAKNGLWLISPAIGIGSVCYANWMLRRPFYASALVKFPIAISLGLIVAKVLNDSKFKRESERDHVLRTYIKLHPEDFPAPKRETFNDVFNDWVPIR